MPILLASAVTFLFTCNQADDVIRNVWQNQLLTPVDQICNIESVLEVTPPECSAHYYNELSFICDQRWSRVY